MSDWQVIHGDCFDVMRGMVERGERVDAVVTDPPYGVAYSGSKTKHGTNGGPYSFADSPELVDSVYVPAIRLAVSLSRAAVVTPGIANCFKYDKPVDMGAIFYPSGANCGPWGFVCSQPILFYGKCPFLARGMGSRPNSFSSTESTDRSIDHPCPKPIGIAMWMVERVSFPGDTILDPFCGSGTTGVACIRLGRRFIGIEKDEKYAAIARERLEAEERGLTLKAARAGQTSIFDVLGSGQ